ncbi:MAG: dienelactone hydrolase family protein [Myxococcales bacterium]
MGQKTAIAEREIRFRAPDGAAIPAFVAEPAGAPSAPRMVIAPEFRGLTPWVRSVARMLAREGFRAVAPEIFARDLLPETADRAELLSRMNRLSIPQAVADLRLALAQLEGGPAGVVGFCLGGSLAVLVAAGGGFSACVDCYGRIRLQNAPLQPIDAARTLDCPVLAIYATRDAGIPVVDAEALRAVLPQGSELSLYDAAHGFLNDTRSDVHAPDQAALAWPKIIGFLRRKLYAGGP